MISVAPVERISIIAPMLNESTHLEQFVADISKQDFEGEVELLVADGGSTDGSVDRLKAAAERRGVALSVLENRAGWVSHALNACIRAAQGDLLVRLDCHSRYPQDYLRRCALAAEETGALAVGGVIVAEGRTPLERAVACAMDSPFGGIGFYRIFSSDGSLARRAAGVFGIPWARNATGDSRVETDTLTFGAFRPEAFRRAGLFDETLRRNQDDEFNLRVRKAGGRVILDPSIRVHYTPRGSFRGVFRQYYEYGLWKVPVMRKHRQVPSPRSLAPLALVSSVALLAPLAPRLPVARRLLAAELGAYAALAVAFGALCVSRRRESWRLLPAVVAVFPTFHAAYGLGMLRGWLRPLRAAR
ncbi:MAG TPA: glycosyltransferase family 2 protein [Gaiellaceae bacterium]|jgi:glycosyltransferase involved in cell wall biosynthesis|nr:glycosyltransferase family 2 protein [Gaiellaceae bacterium]